MPAIVALAGAVVAIGGVIAFFVLEKDEPAPAKAAAPAQLIEEASGNDTEPVTTPDQPAETQATAPKGPDPVDIAANLERELKKQRLWATVSVIGARAEVRSGSCSDPAIAPMLDGAAPAFKAAGLTKLRCVEQSGRVVSDRDL